MIWFDIAAVEQDWNFRGLSEAAEKRESKQVHWLLGKREFLGISRTKRAPTLSAHWAEGNVD